MIDNVEECYSKQSTTVKLWLVGQLITKDQDQAAKQLQQGELQKGMEMLEPYVTALGNQLTWLSQGNESRAELCLA